MNKNLKVMACGLLALSLVGCQKQTTNNVVNEIDTSEIQVDDNTELANPIVDYASAEELAKVIGYDITSYITISDVLAQVTDEMVFYQTVGDEIAQIRIEKSDGSYTEIRASKTLSGVEELAGIYGAGEGIPTAEDEEAAVRYEFGDASEVVVYAQDDINFSILNAGPGYAIDIGSEEESELNENANEDEQTENAENTDENVEEEIAE
jgi:hypothetical protein